MGGGGGGDICNADEPLDCPSKMPVGSVLIEGYATGGSAAPSKPVPTGV